MITKGSRMRGGIGLGGVVAMAALLCLTTGCPQQTGQEDSSQEEMTALMNQLLDEQLAARVTSGDPGPAGPAGEQGEQGDKGDPGTDATTPSGYLLLGESAIAPEGYTYTGATVLKEGTNSFRAVGGPLTEARELPMIGALNGELYLIGGMSLITWFDTNLVEVFNPSTGAFRSAASLNAQRTRGACATVDGKLYVVGGSGPVAHQIEVYDPATNTWTLKAPMPTPRDGLAAVALNGKIYAIGGGTAAVEIYDPVADSWSIGAPLGTSRHEHAAAVLDGRIYVMGGNDGAGPLASVEVFDPAVGAWSEATPLLAPRVALAGGAVNGKLYALPGFGMFADVFSVDAYDPAADTWMTRSDGSSWHGHQGAVMDSAIYTCDGVSVWKYMPPVWYYLHVKN